MHVHINGKHIKYIYSVDRKTKDIETDNKKKTIFLGKPVLVKHPEIKTETIQYLDCDLSFLASSYSYPTLMLDDEEVRIEKKFVDLRTGTLNLNISKILSEEDVNKNIVEMELRDCIEEFNREMIYSNEKLKNYCEVHNLAPELTDAIKLWKIVYPENDFNIMDGKMVCVPNPGKDDFMITGITTKADVASTTGMLGTLSKTYCEACHRIDTTVSSAMV